MDALRFSGFGFGPDNNMKVGDAIRARSGIVRGILGKPF